MKLGDLEERAKEHDIFDITPFLRSKLFKANGYQVAQDGEGKDVILKKFKTSDA